MMLPPEEGGERVLTLGWVFFCAWVEGEGGRLRWESCGRVWDWGKAKILGGWRKEGGREVSGDENEVLTAAIVRWCGLFGPGGEVDGSLCAHLLGQGARAEQGAFDVHVEKSCEFGDIYVGDIGGGLHTYLSR